MIEQSVNIQSNEIEITLTHANLPSQLSKLFYGDANHSKIINFSKNKQTLTIGFSGSKTGDMLYFENVDDLIIHKSKNAMPNSLDYTVALILNSDLKYLPIYAYRQPEFGNELFGALEYMLFNKNKPLKLYDYDEAQLTFNI